MIAFADYRGRHPHATADIVRILRTQAERGEFILKSAVTELEAALCAHARRRHAVCVGSGTAAMMLALKASGVGPGDEVIVPAFCYVAAASCVLQVGATPVFVDVDPERFTLAPEAVRSALTIRTRAVVAAHLFAGLADTPAIAQLLPQGVVLLEDSATAFGARLGGLPAGSLGDLGVYSFFPAKPLGGLGDAGVLLTDDDEVATLARMLRNHGQDGRTRFCHHLLGFNSRMDEVNARWLLEQLPRQAADLAHKQALARRYDAGLGSRVPQLSLQQRGSEDFSPHAYVVRVEGRQALVAHLSACGIQTRVYFAQPLPAQSAFSGAIGQASDFPVATALAAQTLALPLHSALSIGDIDHVLQAIHRFYA